MSENADAQPARAAASPSMLSAFLEQAADIWRRLPHKSLFLVVFAAWVALLHFLGNATVGYGKVSSVFVWALDAYSYREDDAHGRYIPFAILLFLWLKRKELSEIAPRIWWPAAAYFAAAILLHGLAYRVQQPRISVLAFMFGLHALVGLVWGPQALRQTVFPIMLLIFCVPFGVLADSITFHLRIVVTKIAVGIAHNILGIEVFREGSQIFGPKGHAMYDVAPACSGLRSVTAMTALAAIYGFLHLNTTWRRIFLILCGVPLALCGNVARITTVIVVGDAFGQKQGALIEQKLGFLTFAVGLGGLMLIAWMLSDNRKQLPRERVEVLQETPA